MVDLTKPRQPKKRKLVQWTGFLLIAVGILVLSYPLWPIVKYKIFGPTSTPEQPIFPYESQLISANGTINEATTDSSPVTQNTNTQTATKKVSVKVLKKSKPVDNRLVIPKIGVNMPIIEGAIADDALWKGIWHIPGSANPIEGGNMVLSGHRFRYRPPSNLTLYLLDQVKPGDIMIIYWQGKEFDYKVSQTKIVPRENTDMADPSLEPRLTVFTCHPLFSTKNRLVVIGELI
jgi:sortase A